MSEHGFSEVVHCSLPDRYRSFHLRDGEKPSRKKIHQIDHAHHQNATQRRLRRGKVGEKPVDPDLDEFWPQQRGSGGERGEREVQNELPLVRTQIRHQPEERLFAHPLLRELLLQCDVLVL